MLELTLGVAGHAFSFSRRKLPPVTAWGRERGGQLVSTPPTEDNTTKCSLYGRTFPNYAIPRVCRIVETLTL